MTGFVYIQLLSVNSVDSTACVVIATETRRFLINACEGAQRLCVEHKCRLGKLSGVFVTELVAKNICGIPGMCLSAADSGCSGFSVHGPIGIRHFMQSTEYFMHLKQGFDVPTSEYETFNPTHTFTCPEISIHGHMIEVGGQHHIFYLCETECPPGKFDLETALSLGVPKGPAFGLLKKGESVTLADGTVVTPHQVLGKSEGSKWFCILPEISKEHTDTFIELLCKLSAMQMFVTGNDFSGDRLSLECIVHLSDRGAIGMPSYRRLVQTFHGSPVHLSLGKGCCLSRSSYVASTRYTQKLHRICPEIFVPVTLDSQKCPSPVTSDPTAVNLAACGMISAGPQLRYHVVASAAALGATGRLTGAGEQQQQQQEDDCMRAELTEFWTQLTAQQACAEELIGVQRARDLCVSCEMSSDVTHGSETDDVVASLSSRLGLNQPQAACLKQSGDDSLWFLGTGCAVPSKYRNVSGILLQLPRHNSTAGGVGMSIPACSLLLEAGEGTWAQLLRMSTTSSSSNTGMKEEEEEEEVMLRVAQALRVVWISHAHADHHLGLVTVILERKKLLLKCLPEGQSVSSDGGGGDGGGGGVVQPLVVIAPPAVLAFLRDYARIDSTICDAYIAVSTRQLDKYDSCSRPDMYWTSSSTSSTSFSMEESESELIPLSTGPLSPRLQIGALLRDTLPLEDEHDLDERKTNFLSSSSFSAPSSSSQHSNSRYRREQISAELMQQARVNLEKAQQVWRYMGIVDISNVKVAHCAHAYGVCVTIRSNQLTQGNSTLDDNDSHVNSSSSGAGDSYKLVYSGDTRPCKELAALGRGAAVLIHEATFEDDKQAEAVSKRHSTIGEALAVGRAMKAFRVILTHFSQRYQAIPAMAADCGPVAREQAWDSFASAVLDMIDDEDIDSAGAVEYDGSRVPLFAFDFMKVSFKNLLWAPVVTRLITMAFPTDNDDDNKDNDNDNTDNTKKRSTTGSLHQESCVGSNCGCLDDSMMICSDASLLVPATGANNTKKHSVLGRTEPAKAKTSKKPRQQRAADNT